MVPPFGSGLACYHFGHLPPLCCVLCAVPSCCEQKNHLSGLKRKLLKVSFYNVQQLMEVRREVSPIIAANNKRSSMADAVAALAGNGGGRPKVSIR